MSVLKSDVSVFSIYGNMQNTETLFCGACTINNCDSKRTTLGARHTAYGIRHTAHVTRRTVTKKCPLLQ